MGALVSGTARLDGRGKRCRYLALAAAALQIIVGSSTLVGWMLNVGRLKSLIVGMMPMQPMTALMLCIAGVGLMSAVLEEDWPPFAKLRLVAGAGVIVVCGVAIIGHATDAELDLDRLLFASKVSAQTFDYMRHPGRIPEAAALTLFLAGTALVAPRSVPWLRVLYPAAATIALMLSSVIVVGYLLQVPILYGAGFYTWVAIHAAISMAVLAVGLLMARPDVGWIAILTASGPGSAAARRLLPFVVCAPIFLAVGIFWLGETGAADPRLQTALLVVFTATVLTAILLRNAVMVNHLSTQTGALEAGLTVTREQLDLAHGAAGVGVWDWNMTTGTVRWSDSFRRLHGLDRSHTPSYETWRACVHPDDRARVDDETRRIILTREARPNEFRIRLPDGTVRWIMAMGKVLQDTDGGDIRMIGLCVDVTDRVEAADALRRAKDEADRANLARSRFLAAASHDLRQPVQGLFMFLEALRLRLDDDASLAIVAATQQALDALKLLLDGLMEISRLDAGLVVPRKIPMRTAPLLDRLATEYRDLAAARKLKFRVLIVDAVVESDPELLERMLRSLLDNALRYTRTGGILLGCRRREGGVRIEVVDTGIGIPSDKIDAIFEEFFQVGNPERDRTKGLGLGLAVARRLGALLHHEVGVVSRCGGGSRFFVTVPIAEGYGRRSTGRA